MADTHRVELADGPVEVRGALDLERTAAGVLPWRLPAWTRPQYDERMADVVAQPSGVRLAFRTAATALELEVLTSVWHYADKAEPEPAGMIDLVIDGAYAGGSGVPTGNILYEQDPGGTKRLVAGEPGRVRFDGLPAGEKDVELWLPPQTRTELVALWADAEVSPPRPTGLRRWVHYGSSISHCQEAASPTATWPVVAASLGGVEAWNLGFSGNAHLDPYVARTIRDLPADLISLKLGINVVNLASMRLRTFAPAVHGFIDLIRDGHPETPLLLISPVLCPVAEEVPGPTSTEPGGAGPTVALGDPDDVAEGALTLTVIRDTLAAIVDGRAGHDPHLHYLDGRELFGSGDLADLPDGLHPNADGYRRMGRRFAALAFGPGGVFAGP